MKSRKINCKRRIMAVANEDTLQQIKSVPQSNLFQEWVVRPIRGGSLQFLLHVAFLRLSKKNVSIASMSRIRDPHETPFKSVSVWRVFLMTCTNLMARCFSKFRTYGSLLMSNYINEHIRVPGRR